MKKILTLALMLGAASLNAASPAPKPFPASLKTCVVSGDKLTEMGKPYVFTYEGQEVKLCCKDCLKDFNKDPAKYMKKINAAAPAKKK